MKDFLKCKLLIKDQISNSKQTINYRDNLTQVHFKGNPCYQRQIESLNLLQVQCCARVLIRNTHDLPYAKEKMLP